MAFKRSAVRSRLSPPKSTDFHSKRVKIGTFLFASVLLSIWFRAKIEPPYFFLSGQIPAILSWPLLSVLLSYLQRHTRTVGGSRSSRSITERVKPFFFFVPLFQKGGRYHVCNIFWPVPASYDAVYIRFYDDCTDCLVFRQKKITAPSYQLKRLFF